MGDTNLQRVQQEKDLGIMITSNLSWDAHIFSVVNKANTHLLSRNCAMQRRYGYHAATAKLQMVLEMVQRRATRWILKTNVGEMPYEDRLTI